MIIVTGGAGFIGSNIVKTLNNQNIDDIIVVDDLSNGKKFINIADCQISDYLDKDTFIKYCQNDFNFGKLEAIIHQGAESATTQWDGKYMLSNNFEYSKQLLHYAQRKKATFLYASSAAVYGASQTFKEAVQYEAPLNVYGYSKLLFDQYVRRLLPQAKSQIAGFRYFNVYGPRENHKGEMSSVAYHLNNQIKQGQNLKLFQGCDGYGDGGQKRDFIYVQDCVDVNLWFLNNPAHSGIFNVGTGRSQSFREVAQAVIDYHNKGRIEYIPFPDNLKGRYQSFTQADISQLRSVGYPGEFQRVETGVKAYLQLLNQ